MAETTGIDWADSTFNPWIGCTRVGPGCDNCYAEQWAKARAKDVVWGKPGQRGTYRQTSRATWDAVRKWERNHEAFFQEHGRQRRVFGGSLCDPFDNQVPEAWRHCYWTLINNTKHLTWIIVTKRPENFERFLPLDWGDGWPNVWLVVTTENQDAADRRIPILLRTPAAVRGISAEPLLGPLDFSMIGCDHPDHCAGGCVSALTGDWWPALGDADQEWRERITEDSPNGNLLPGLDWVVVGGESGPGARPMHPDWPRLIRDQCVAADVPYFFKQHGEWAAINVDEVPESFSNPSIDLYRCMSSCGYVGDMTLGSALHHSPARFPDCYPDGEDKESEAICNPTYIKRVGKKAAGTLLDGQVWEQYPEGKQ